jgi:hypothetical protein
LTRGRIRVDHVSGRLVFENIYCESELGDRLDMMIRNGEHIFTGCVFSVRDPRPSVIRPGLSQFTGLNYTSDPQPAVMQGELDAHLAENNALASTELPAKEEDSPPPPVSSLERRRRRVQRILQERAETDQDAD